MHAEQRRSTTMPPGQKRAGTGMRRAQIPQDDCISRFDDDDFSDAGIWARLPEGLFDRVMDYNNSERTFIEQLEKLLELRDQNV